MARYWLNVVLAPLPDEATGPPAEWIENYPDGTLFAGDWVEPPLSFDDWDVIGRAAIHAIARRVAEDGWPKTKSEDE